MELSHLSLSFDSSCYYTGDRIEVRPQREIRCEHGFICDPEPIKDAQWLCPKCQCPWPRKRGKPIGTRCINTGSAQRVLEALKSKPVKTHDELFDLVKDSMNRKQMLGGIFSLRRAGYDVPKLEKTKRRRDGFPDFSREKT